MSRPFFRPRGRSYRSQLFFRCYEWKLDTLPLNRSVPRRNRYTPEFPKNRHQYKPGAGQEDSPASEISEISETGSGVAATAARNSSGPLVRSRETTRNQPPRAIKAPKGATAISLG